MKQIVFQDNLIFNNQMNRITVVMQCHPHLQVTSVTTLEDSIDLNYINDKEMERLLLAGRKIYIEGKLK